MNNIINFFTTCEQLVLINENQMFIGYKKIIIIETHTQIGMSFSLLVAKIIIGRFIYPKC